MPAEVLVMRSAAPYERRAAAVSALIHALRLDGRVGLRCLDGDPAEDLGPEARSLLQAVRADEAVRRKAGPPRFRFFRQDLWPPLVPNFDKYSRAALVELVLWCLQVAIYVDGEVVFDADDFLHNAWVYQTKALPPQPELATILAEHPGTLLPPSHPGLDLDN